MSRYHKAKHTHAHRRTSLWMGSKHHPLIHLHHVVRHAISFALAFTVAVATLVTTFDQLPAQGRYKLSQISSPLTGSALNTIEGLKNNVLDQLNIKNQP